MSNILDFESVCRESSEVFHRFFSRRCRVIAPWIIPPR